MSPDDGNPTTVGESAGAASSPGMKVRQSPAVARAEADAERIRAEARADAAAIVAQAQRELGRIRREVRMARYGGRRSGQIKVRRFDPVAVLAVMSRELTVFLGSWRSMTFAAIVEPTIFLVGFGYGFGALVAHVSGVDYISFVGTGIVAVTVVFASAFPAMFTTFVKRRFQRVYDALLSTPVDVNELVTAEVLWLALRAGVYSMAPVSVAVGLGLRPQWGVAYVPLIGFVTGIGFASFGVIVSASVNSIDKFAYVISGVLTPLLLAAGTYFPIDRLPRWAFVAAQVNPLYHCVQLVRHAVFGLHGQSDLIHVGVLVGFAVLMWMIAVRRLRPELID